MERKPQNYSNHAKFDPKFHFVLFPILLVNFILSLAALRVPSLERLWDVVMAFGWILLFFTVRLYALKVQTRVIRLEERLRLNSLLPEPLRGRIRELTEEQLVALRFASDAELPALVERTLADKLGGKAIKQSVQSWVPDYFRV